ncbi:MAG TPA: metallophosphoesterase [Candidatus Acidoferrum sp.]|nr:metallophosphoesterase [Candidatus Acidoferrum sp.]
MLVVIAFRPLVVVAWLVAMTFAPLRAAAAPWLFVSDIHLDPVSRRPTPVSLGKDTNQALFRSALDAMKRADPNPPVVFITGDFFSHGFDYRRAGPTMSEIARRFGEAFPHAQFVVALGNEDSPCADYTLNPNAPFLRSFAEVWGPLVNRHGAAPDFVRTVSHDGFYTTKLPLRNVRAVVIDDVFWSPRYHPGCGPARTYGPAETVKDLASALTPGGDEKRWLIMHIPPGIDAWSTTHLAHRLAVVPFLEPGPRGDLMTLLGERQRHVSLVIAAHIHKFSYRVYSPPGRDPLPIFLAPSVSPIFWNNPSFLTVDVAPDGTIQNAEDHAFVKRQWRDIGGWRSLGVRSFTGEELLALQTRLDRDPALRARYASLYNGGAPPEITEGNWPGYACASIAFAATDYRSCLGESGISIFTRRGLAVLGVVVAVAVAVLAAAVAAIVIVVRRRKAVSRR